MIVADRPTYTGSLHTDACAAYGWASQHANDSDLAVQALASEIAGAVDTYESTHYKNQGYAEAAVEAMWPDIIQAETDARNGDD